MKVTSTEDIKQNIESGEEKRNVKMTDYNAS